MTRLAFKEIAEPTIILHRLCPVNVMRALFPGPARHHGDLSVLIPSLAEDADQPVDLVNQEVLAGKKLKSTPGRMRCERCLALALALLK